MKKLLILVLITLLTALIVFIGLNGLKLGGIEVLGIDGINQKNSELDLKIQEAGKLAEKDYQQAVQEVNRSTKDLKQIKSEYEDMTAVTSEEDIQAASQLDKYKIEALWVKIGNHAKREGCELKMVVERGVNTVEDIYNLRFTVNGSYIGITDFISDIENDSELGFKIEEFKMIPIVGNITEKYTDESGTERTRTKTGITTMEGSFVCNGITIKGISELAEEKTEKEKTEEKNENSNDTNTTNTTNTSNTTNTQNTNSTNTVELNNTTNTSNTTNSTNTSNTAE